MLGSWSSAVWTRMWLQREAATTLGWLRIGLVSVFLIDYLALAPLLRTAPPESLGAMTKTLHPEAWFSSIAVVAFGLGVAAHGAWLLGLWTRVASLGAWISWILVARCNPWIFALPDQWRFVLCTWLMLMPGGAALSLDAGRRGPRRVSVAWRRILQVQLGVFYATTAWLKSGPTWRVEGTAVYYALVHPLNARFDLAGAYAAMHPWLLRPASVLVLVWEGAFALFVVVAIAREVAPSRNRWPDLRPIMLGLGVAIHGGVTALMSVGSFTPLVWLAYLGWVPPDELAALRRRWRRFRGETLVE